MAEFRFQAGARISLLINTSELRLGNAHTPVQRVPRGVKQPQLVTDHLTAPVLNRPFASSYQRYLAYNLIFTPSTYQNSCLRQRGNIATPSTQRLKCGPSIKCSYSQTRCSCPHNSAINISLSLLTKLIGKYQYIRIFSVPMLSTGLAYLPLIDIQTLTAPLFITSDYED